jgi:hypothetical protein
MPVSDRRAFLRGAGIGLLGFTVAGAESLLTPRQARAAAADLKVLSTDEARRLEAVAEVFAPGAAEAGVAWFVDQQLGVPPNDSLLMAKYFNVEPPYADFYRACLASMDEWAQNRHQTDFAELAAEVAAPLLGEMLAGEPEGWNGPPALLVYLVLRNDAVDVVYGTYEGIERLGVPLMAHIKPPARW